MSFDSIDEIIEFENALNCGTDINKSADQLIQDEFGQIISERICSGRYEIVPKHNRLRIDTTKLPLIVSKERLFITPEIISDVMADMKQTHNKRNLIQALERNGILSATDGHTHPVNAYDINGKPIRIYCYDIDSYILNADAYELIENPESAGYFIGQDEIPSSDFLSLVSRSDGRVAGKMMRYKDLENNSIAIW